MKDVPWNANVDDDALNKKIEESPIRFQASAFNGCARIFAPLYRQANLKVLLVPETDQAKAGLDFAYADVKRAFESYLQYENKGRPIIIAGHSQGSQLAIRLVRDYFDDKPLQKQLVCAYKVGALVGKSAFTTIPLGITPTATDCYVSWRSFQKGELPKSVKNETDTASCVNPITWTNSQDWAPKELHQGSLESDFAIAPHSVAAGVNPPSKILWVSIPDNAPKAMKASKNLHIWDYNLFWLNIRQNAQARVEAFVQITGFMTEE